MPLYGTHVLLYNLKFDQWKSINYKFSKVIPLRHQFADREAFEWIAAHLICELAIHLRGGARNPKSKLLSFYASTVMITTTGIKVFSWDILLKKQVASLIRRRTVHYIIQLMYCLKLLVVIGRLQTVFALSLFYEALLFLPCKYQRLCLQVSSPPGYCCRPHGQSR